MLNFNDWSAKKRGLGRSAWEEVTGILNFPFGTKISLDVEITRPLLDWLQRKVMLMGLEVYGPLR